MQNVYDNARVMLLQLSRTQIRKRENISLVLNIPQLGEITCTKILRGVSGKRLVCYAYQGEKEFVLKIFFHPSRAEKHWSISNHGLNLFNKKSILTPEIFFSGYLQTEDLYVILLKYLKNSISFTEESKNYRSAFTHKMISCLAEQHDKGIIQKDANPGNFLLYQDNIYSLDGDHVHDLKTGLSKKKGLKNLAVFCSKLSTICPLDLEACYREYAQQRNWAIARNDIKYFWGKFRFYTMQVSLRRMLKILKRKMKLLE